MWSIAVQHTFRMQSHFNLSCIFQILNLFFLLNIYVAYFLNAVPVLHISFHSFAQNPNSNWSTPTFFPYPVELQKFYFS